MVGAYGIKKFLFCVYIKSVFVHATETERLEHGTARSAVN